MARKIGIYFDSSSKNSDLLYQLLEKITQSTINYLKGQVSAGADLLQIFDSWAGVLSEAMYYEFSLKYISKICDALSPLVPVTVFAKDAHYAIEKISGIKSPK